MITEQTNHTSTQDRKRLEKDSVFVYIQDSVFIKIKGDTVLKERFRTEYRDRFQDRFDTLKISDTIRSKEIKYISKTSVSGWQNFQIWCGRILLLFLLLYLVYKISKRYLKRI